MKRIQKNFAKNVFDHGKMKKYLSKKTYRAIVRAETFGESLSPKDAENYAKGVRKWAISRGVTRFTHLFQPLNNFTAGKRESLISVDKHGNPVVKFRGKELQKGEGDASSFPSGGIRQTFEARGITLWDCTSAAFIKNGCLCIPSTFCSHTGEALDKKTPLLKSCAALNRQAVRLMKLAGTPCKRVFSVVGAEQEYFLVDKAKFLQRPDLVCTGRTLIGMPPPKGQELNDHYYRPPNEKIVKFWQEADERLWQLGIVAKTEHKEVAPSQFELAPCYSAVNVACDQNQIIMEILAEVADKFGLVCLLHEKPFDKVNGSGKHNNWSLLTDKDENLLENGDTALLNARFALFVACIVRAVDLHQDLLRFSVCSASNDCRLGGYEAPPQTISMFLGKIYPALMKDLDDENWKLGVDRLSQTESGTDRNRTSPFAFTGNKFEFRMVGSSASPADCNTVLNTIVADSVQTVADALQNSQNFWADAKKLIKEIFEKHGKIVFNGNNYSADWVEEAKKRSLLHVENTPLAATFLTKKDNVLLFEKQRVFSARELCALQSITLENYVNTVTVEANTLVQMVFRQILPVAHNYAGLLVQNAVVKQNLGQNADAEIFTIKRVGELTKKLQRHCKKLQKTAAYNSCENLQQKAQFACEVVRKQETEVRKLADALEEILPENLWPFPSYAQMLLEN